MRLFNSLPHPEEDRRPVSKGFLGLLRQPVSAVLSTLVLIAGISPASATGTVECEAPDGAASLMLTIGSLPVLGVVHMEVTAGDRTWSTDGSGDGAISIGQAFRDGERWLIDATDPNIEGIVAEVRLNQAIEGRDMALAGTLKIRGTGAWAITCIGP
jgi:hypothetical protein